MTVTVRCPFCGTEQRGLHLDETNGKFICSKCQKECQVPQQVERDCFSCRYYYYTEEYWHDHYLIPAHHCCTYKSKYDPVDIDPHGCCNNYQRKTEEKSE